MDVDRFDLRPAETREERMSGGSSRGFAGSGHAAAPRKVSGRSWRIATWERWTLREGKFGEAVAHLEQAVRVEPRSATARNGLGAGLLAEGHVDDAIRKLREALREDPAHLNAR